MVAAAFWTLTIAAAAGTVLVFWHLRATEGTARPPLAAGIAHGVAGAAGLGLLLLALRGPARGVAAGVGSFGTIAAGLFAVALASGVLLLTVRRTAVVMAIHASLAVAGYALLLAWNGLGG